MLPFLAERTTDYHYDKTYNGAPERYTRLDREIAMSKKGRFDRDFLHQSPEKRGTKVVCSKAAKDDAAAGKSNKNIFALEGRAKLIEQQDRLAQA